MSDDVILEYVKSIDARGARMEEAVNKILTDHDSRLKSLETSRTAARAGMTALVLGGTGGAAKAGMLDKLLSLFGGGT